LFELINNPLQPKHFAALTGNAIEVSNPQSIDMKYLRTSLLSGALNVVSRNLNRGEKNLALYEIGNIFNLKEGKKVVSSFNAFDEQETLIFILTGNKIEREWYSDTESFNFYDLKGMVNSFIDKISLDNLLNDSYYATDNSIYEYYLTKIFKDRLIGNGGKVKDQVLKQFDIDQDVYCFEFNLDALKEIPVVSKKYAKLLRYPKVILDFAFIFDKQTKFEDVSEFINNKGSKLLKNVNVFDIFESKEFGNNKKSMAFQLEYFDSSRTLTENEVEKDFENIIKLVSKKFNAKLRGKWVADMSKYEAMINDLSILESQISILKNQFKDGVKRNEELEVALEKSKQDNTSLYKKIAALEEELNELNTNAENGLILGLTDSNEKESFKIRLQELISRIDYHLTVDRQI